MLRPARFLLASLLPALIAACGARSTLHDDGAGQGGAGGAGSTSSSTSATSTTSVSSTTTSGGAGGAPAACDALVLSGEPITPEAEPFEHGLRPRLVPAAGDGSLVSVVVARQAVEGPAVPPARITRAEVAPWGAWPSTLGTEYQVCSFGGEAFAAAPAMPDARPGIAALFYLPTAQFPSDMYLAPVVSARTSYDPFPDGVQWDAWEPAFAAALARGGEGHLAAYELVLGGVSGTATYLGVSLVGAASLDVQPIDPVACAEAPFPADAAPIAGGFLVAAASGRPFGTCQRDDGVPGPADELQVIRIEEATHQTSLSASFQERDPLAHVALAAGGGGAWVVWQASGASALQPPPVRAMRLDEAGAPAGSVFQVTAEGATAGPIAAAALGSWLAVAWVDAIDPSFPTLRVDLFDEAGAFRTGTSISTAPSWLFDASLSLLASPDGTQLLLAWSDVAASGMEAAAVRVARFSCAQGL